MRMTTQKSIKSGDWELVIDLAGGRIVSLKKAGRLILGTFSRIDGKTGNTHLCVPNFADEGSNLGLPFHGPARNSTWQVGFCGDSSILIGIVLDKSLLYPIRLQVRQKFVFGVNFSQQIEIKNIGRLSAPVNLGIHYYWSTPAGMTGTRVNGHDITDLIKDNKEIGLLPVNRIIFPKQTPIVMRTEGFPRAVVWTGFRAQAGKKIFDDHYCCIEPVAGRFDSVSSRLAGQAQRIYRVVIEV